MESVKKYIAAHDVDREDLTRAQVKQAVADLSVVDYPKTYLKELPANLPDAESMFGVSFLVSDDGLDHFFMIKVVGDRNTYKGKCSNIICKLDSALPIAQIGMYSWVKVVKDPQNYAIEAHRLNESGGVSSDVHVENLLKSHEASMNNSFTNAVTEMKPRTKSSVMMTPFLYSQFKANLKIVAEQIHTYQKRIEVLNEKAKNLSGTLSSYASEFEENWYDVYTKAYLDISVTPPYTSEELNDNQSHYEPVMADTLPLQLDNLNDINAKFRALVLQV